MKTVIYTKEMQKAVERKKRERLIHHGKRIHKYTLETLNMLAEKHNCNIEDIELDDAYYMLFYRLNDEIIYFD